MDIEPMGLFPFGLLGWLAGLIFFAGIVLLVIWAARAFGGPAASRAAVPAPSGAPAETPLDILARRFASGEITAEEYQKAREVLTPPPPPPPK